MKSDGLPSVVSHCGIPGTSMSKALSRRSRDFFRGNPKHLFGVTHPGFGGHDA